MRPGCLGRIIIVKPSRCSNFHLLTLSVLHDYGFGRWMHGLKVSFRMGQRLFILSSHMQEGQESGMRSREYA